jgi:hypothetical protein
MSTTATTTATSTTIEPTYDEHSSCKHCGWNSALMESHAIAAACDGCKYMESRYDTTTEDGEVQCTEKPWYAAKLETKIIALHDREMDWRELLERINSDDELCHLDLGRLEQQAPETAAGRRSSILGFIWGTSSLSKQSTAAYLAPASAGTSSSPSSSACDTSGAPARPSPPSPLLPPTSESE